MARLCAQLQQKLQLDYKTNITLNLQKIKLCGSLTTKELKKPHSSRWEGGTGTWRHAERCGEVQRAAERHGDVKWVVPHPCVVDKNREGCLGSKASQPYTRPLNPGFQCQESKSP